MFTLSSFFKVYLFGVVCGAVFIAAIVFLPALVYRVVGWNRRFRAFVRRSLVRFTDWYGQFADDLSGIFFVACIMVCLLLSWIVTA